jgi:quercetin dioxygenase-like cupin family protein
MIRHLVVEKIFLTSDFLTYQPGVSCKCSVKSTDVLSPFRQKFKPSPAAHGVVVDLKEASMKIVKTSQVTKKPFEKPIFTGSDVTIQELLADSQEYRINIVNFGKGVRNKFHTHSTEQVLIITAGKGIVATEKEERIVIEGDIVLIPAGEKHWHGATQDSDFSHIYVIRKESVFSQLED